MRTVYSPHAEFAVPEAVFQTSGLIQMSILLVTIAKDLTGASNVNITTSRRCSHFLWHVCLMR